MEERKLSKFCKEVGGECWGEETNMRGRELQEEEEEVGRSGEWQM